MDKDERLRMRWLAMGRLQAAAAVRIDVEETITMSLRGAHRLGATIQELRIESGLSERVVRRVVRGGKL